MRHVPAAVVRLTRSFWRRHWLPLTAAVLIGSVALAQGFQPNFIRNFLGPISVTGGLTATGNLAANSATITNSVTAGTNLVAGNGVSGSFYVATGTSGDQYSCSGAAACSIASASGRDIALDCGGGTCAVKLGAANATSISIGRSGQTVSVSAPLSAGSNNITTTGRYCTDVACTTNYIVNDTFGKTNFVGAASFTNNVEIVGFVTAGDYLKLDATAVSGGSACSAGNEGKIRRDSAGGGTTGHRTKICLCTSDGAGSPAYAWQNIVSGTVGTTTACND